MVEEEDFHQEDEEEEVEVDGTLAFQRTSRNYCHCNCMQQIGNTYTHTHTLCYCCSSGGRDGGRGGGRGGRDGGRGGGRGGGRYVCVSPLFGFSQYCQIHTLIHININTFIFKQWCWRTWGWHERWCQGHCGTTSP